MFTVRQIEQTLETGDAPLPPETPIEIRVEKEKRMYKIEECNYRLDSSDGTANCIYVLTPVDDTVEMME